MAHEIERLADDLFASGESREFSQVIASRLHTTEAVVDWYMAGLAIQHRADARNLRAGFRNADVMATEAAQGVWE